MISTRANIPLLLVLRGIATLIVVFYHATIVSRDYLGLELLNNILYFGYSGVDIFFILSGFLIPYVHYNDSKTIKNLKHFTLKRFIRIYPVYLTVLIPIMVFKLLTPEFSNLQSSSGLLILNSILLLPSSQFTILGVSWTLTYEILFYIIFSLFFICPKKVSTLIFIVWISVSTSNFAYQLIYGTNIFQNIYANTLFSKLNIYFGMGFLIFLIRNRIYHSNIILYSGLGLYLIVASNYSFLSSLIFWDRIIFFGLPASLIMLGIVSKKREKGSYRLFDHLGEMSYSLYLLHSPMLVFLMITLNKVGINLVINCFISILIVIFSSYYFHIHIEKKIISALKITLLRKSSQKK